MNETYETNDPNKTKPTNNATIRVRLPGVVT
jgi:hypothetical protein